MTSKIVAYQVNNHRKPCEYHIDEQEAIDAAATLRGGGGSVTPVTLAELVRDLNELVPGVRNLSISGP